MGGSRLISFSFHLRVDPESSLVPLPLPPPLSDVATRACLRSPPSRQPAFPPSESHLVRIFGSEILLFSTNNLSPSSSPVSRFRVENLKGIWVGGGPEGEGVAVFVGEKNGAPASLSLFSIATLSGSQPTATATKSFYKADKVQVKWNPAGSMVRLLSTDRVRIGSFAWLSD